MKKNLIYLFCLLPFLSFSQITIQQSALPVVGNSWATYNDNNPVSLSITPPGPAQNWNFSIGWVVGLPTIDNFISPSSLIGSSQFPSSNIALQKRDRSFRN